MIKLRFGVPDLDGVMQAPGGPDEDRRGGFEYGGWQQAYFDDIEGDIIMKGLSELVASFFRKTYDIFAAFWPLQPADDPWAFITFPQKITVAQGRPLAWTGQL
jgi:hypothetical protein